MGRTRQQLEDELISLTLNNLEGGDEGISEYQRGVAEGERRQLEKSIEDCKAACAMGMEIGGKW